MATTTAIYEAAWEAGFPEVVVAPVLVTLDELQQGLASTAFWQEALREGIGP